MHFNNASTLRLRSILRTCSYYTSTRRGKLPLLQSSPYARAFSTPTMNFLSNTRLYLRLSRNLPTPPCYTRSLSILLTSTIQTTLTPSHSSVFKPGHLISRNQRTFSSSTAFTMSFSNTDTGDKPADPYKAKNKEDPSLAEKVEGLSKFVDSCKFAMMTTRIESRGLLVSRAMAVAGKV